MVREYKRRKMYNRTKYGNKGFGWLANKLGDWDEALERKKYYKKRRRERET